MSICLAAECTATYSLTKYEALQTNIEMAGGHLSHLHNNDLIAAQCFDNRILRLVATIFGADFFFLLFFPRRTYPTWYNRRGRVLAWEFHIGVFAAALMSSVSYLSAQPMPAKVPELTSPNPDCGGAPFSIYYGRGEATKEELMNISSATPQ